MYKHIITGKTCMVLETKKINDVQYVIYEKTMPEYGFKNIGDKIVETTEIKMTKFAKPKKQFDLFYKKVKE